MSIIFTFTGNESLLSADFDPPIFLDDEHEYVIGLLSFETYHTIPNITQGKNDVFKVTGLKDIVLPPGSYELNEIDWYIQDQLKGTGVSVGMEGNNSSSHTIIKSSRELDFTTPNSIGGLLGFDKVKIPANKSTKSDHIARIMKINSILIHCNISAGSYKNGKPRHIIHQFFPVVPPGFKIVETPNPVVYLPINTKTITSITIQILDQDDEPISFSSETITITLHLKRV